MNGLSKINSMLVPSSTNMNGQFYATDVLPNWLEFLQNDSKFHPGVRTFIYDGAPCHTSYLAKVMLDLLHQEIGESTLTRKVARFKPNREPVASSSKICVRGAKASHFGSAQGASDSKMADFG